VQEEEPFRKLASALRTLETFLMADPCRKAKIFQKPFIKLGHFPNQVNQGDWFQYSHQLFHAAFTACQLLMVKKIGNHWKTISVFPFKPCT
jgi:hypothetical protein